MYISIIIISFDATGAYILAIYKMFCISVIIRINKTLQRVFKAYFEVEWVTEFFLRGTISGL